MRYWIQMSAAALVATLGVVQAETNEVVRTDEVVVSATRTERLRSEIPVSVAVVPEHEIKKKPAQSVLEVLRDLPGVTISDNGGNGLKYVRIRGESNRRTLVLLDGQPLSQQKSMEGGMPFVGKNQIERIEVVKGPSSVLYGSEAIGGTINIITKKSGDKPIGGGISTSYDSSNDGFRQDYDVRGTVQGVEYAVSYGKSESGNRETAEGHLDEGGMNAKDPSVKRTAGTGSNSEEYSVYLGYKTNNIHAGIRYDHHKLDYDIFSEQNAETSEVIPGVARMTTQDAYMDIPMSEREKVSGFLEFTDLTETFKTLRFDAYRQETKRDFDIFIDFLWEAKFGPWVPVGDYTLNTRTHNEQVSLGGEVQADWEFGDHYVVAGLTVNHDDIDGTTKTKTRYGSLVATFFGPETPCEHFVYDAEMLTAAAFIQDEWKVTDKTRLIGGARYTYIESDLNNTDDPDIPFTSGGSQDDNMAFSLGVVHQATSNLTLRANYSQGYRHANLVELYTGAPAHGTTPAIAGNSGLAPETSQSFELGALYQGDRFTAEASVFYTETKDYITTDVTQYINVGGAETFGAELSLAYDLGDSGFTPYVNLTYLQRELDYGTGSVVESTKDSGVAELSGRAGLRYVADISETSSVNVDFFSRFASNTKIEYSDGTGLKEDGWGTANLEVSYLLDEFVNLTESTPVSLEVYVGIYNLFDKNYTPFDELQAAGRHAVVGLNLTF